MCIKSKKNCWEDQTDLFASTGDVEEVIVKYKARHDHHRTKRTFRVEDRVWLQLNKEGLQGFGKKIKALQYGPFEVLEKVGDNAYKFSLPPNMCIYLVVNVKILKLYEPSLLDQEEQVLPSIEGLTPDAQAELGEDIIL